MSERSRLRVGLLLSGPRSTAWVARMVEQIQSGGAADVVLAVLDTTPPPAPAASLPKRLLAEPRKTLAQVGARVLERLLQRLGQSPAELADAFASVDLLARLPGVATLEVCPTRTLWSDRFSADEVAQIRAHDLDVLVRIGFRILRGEVLHAARHGVWSFHHGDNDVNRGGPPGYWESMQGWPATGCTLQVLSEDLDNGLVLDKTWACTIDGNVADNNRSTYWKSLALMPRNLAALQRLGAEAFFAQARARQPHPQWYSQRLYRAPESTELLRLLLARLWRRACLAVRTRLVIGQWVLLLHRAEGLSLSIWRYQRLLPPKDRFWADPFLIEHQGRTWLYYEELLFATGKGHIAVAEIDERGRMVAPQPALVTDHHLSYPFVFEHEGQLYMVPESRGDRCVPLYRCEGVPARWVKVHDLMTDVEAVDATLVEHEGRWWMFVNMVANPGGSSCDELFLFHADSPLSQQWTPHPLNPVVSDVRRARPAGRLFVQDGRLYRPSQDCSGHYGRGLNFNWVKTLSVEAYDEECVSRATPDWAPDVRGVHTFNRGGGWNALDAEIRRSRWG